MASFSRAPLNLTIALFVAALSWVWRSCRSFFPRCAWRARESFDWTRGTTPTHTPPTPRLVWLSSIFLSDWVAMGSSHCSRCPTPPPPGPPLPPPPLSLSAPSPPPPPPPLLLLPLLSVEFLSLSLEGPRPPLGQPMNCPLRPLSGFSWLRWPRSSALQGALTPWIAQAAGQEGTEPIYAAPLMELLLVSPRPSCRIGRWACRRASCPR